MHGAGYAGGVMVVGSSPHQWDDQDNTPFTGKEGNLLRHICQAAGIPIDKVYRSQAVKCRAPGDRPPKKSEIDACHPHLIAEIKAVKPKVIVALGDAALQSLYGGDHGDDYEKQLAEWQRGVEIDLQEHEDALFSWNAMSGTSKVAKDDRAAAFPDGKPKKFKQPPKPKKPKATHVGLKDVAGHTLVQPDTGIPIVATYHPRYLMRKRWHLVNIVVSHFKKAQRMWQGTQVVGSLGDYSVIDSIDLLEALRDYLLSDDVDVIWFDCETTGLKWMDDEVLCWQFAGAAGEGYTVPLLYNPGDGDTTNPENGNVDLHPAWGDPADFRKMVAILREIFESDKPKGGHNCFTPETKVLTEDLRWVEIDHVHSGMRLVGFDEEASIGGRRYRPSTVEYVERRQAEVFKLTMLDGSVLNVTKDHPLLSTGYGQASRWVTVGQMRSRGYGYPQLAKVLEPWEVDDSYHAGWVSGFLDADGTLSQQPQLMVGQAECNGHLLDQFVDFMGLLGMDSIRRTPRVVKEGYNDGRSVFVDVATRGAWSGITSFVGRVRPAKILHQWARWLDRAAWCLRPVHTKIVSIEPLGIQSVVNIQTTSRTFIAEGYAVHNCIFDRRMLERDSKQDFISAVTGFAIKVNGRIIDTELTHVSVAESLPHNMTSVLANETDMPYYEEHVRDHKKAMAKAPNGPVWQYGAADADGLPRMHAPLRARAEAEGVDWVLDNVTTPLLDVCRDIEERGFLVDTAHFNKLCLFYHDQQRIWEDHLWFTIPSRQPGWKYGYSPELQTVLFKELGLPKSGRLTKAAKECPDCATQSCDKHDQTGADALKDIFRIQPHPVIPILLRLKKITKMISTYLDGRDGRGGFTKYFRADGRIHTTAKVSRAETGRLATEAPNAQNMVNYLHIHPRGGTCSDAKCDQFFDETFGIDSENAYHDIVVAKPGYGIMNADWSQAEVWGLAYRLLKYTGDRTLMDVLESGVDIHLWMARKMYPTVDPNMEDGLWKNTHSWRRRRAKTCIFGIGYGLTAQGFALREGCTEEEAQETIDLYMAVVPGLPRLFAIVRAQLLKHGYIENEFKRRRHIDTLPLLQAMRERGEFEGLVREGINFPIQSSCSDLHSLASYQTFKSVVIAARQAGIILTVHDSLTFEFWYPNEEEAVKTAHLIKDLWEKVAWNTIKPDGEPLHWKIPVECEWGLSWGTPLWKLDARGTLKKLTKDVIAEEDKPVDYEEEVDPVTDKVISFEPINIDRVA